MFELARLRAEIEPGPGEEVGRVAFLFELDAEPPVVLRHGESAFETGCSARTSGRAGVGTPLHGSEDAADGATVRKGGDESCREHAHG